MSESIKPLLVQKVESYFNENDWHGIEFDERYSVFQAGVTLHCKLKSTRIRVFCRDNGIKVQFPISIGTDDQCENQVMEFITRANYGMNFGGFQMDLDDNTIQYVMFLPCEDVPTTSAIHSMLMTGLYMLDRYGDELLAVMFGMKNAKDAVEAAESKGN